MSFWIIVTVLLAGTILYVAASARRTRQAPAESAESIYAARAEELAGDLEAGTLDGAQAEAVRREVARSALHELPATPGPVRPGARRAAFVLLTLLLPAIALPLYFTIGNPALLDPQAAGGANEHMTMAQMVEQLQQRIDAKPDDPEARLWMARVMMVTEQYGRAVDQYAKVVEIVGERPEVLVQYADALAMVNGGRMAGKPLELVERALAVEPRHVTALWLAGLAAQEANDLPKAREYLTRARAASVDAGQPTEELDQQLASLGVEAADTGHDESRHADADADAPLPADGDSAAGDAVPAGGSASASESTPAGEAAAASGPSFRVQVSLAPALASRVGPDAVLFVLAKNPSGMPMPLAVQRLPATGLPLSVTLDDSVAMSPAARLSSAREVEIIARVSQSGQAVAASGDLEGRVGPLAVEGSKDVTLLIDSVVP